MHRIVAYTFPNIYENNHPFLSSIKRDAHKRKLVLSFLPHGIDTRNVLLLRLLVLSMVWPTLGSRTAEEQNTRTEPSYATTCSPLHAPSYLR